MKRCENNWMSANNIREVRDLADRLLRELADLHFVMTTEEQAGIYSLIRALDNEIWDRDLACDYTPLTQQDYDRWGSNKLKELLSEIKGEDYRDE